MRVERSELAVPASHWRMIEKGVASAADVVFLDLEDAVAPAEKAASRANVIRALRELDWHGKPRTYRVNALDTPYFYRDVIEVVEAAGNDLDLVILPKANRPDDVYVVETLLTQIELALGITRRIGIEVQIETAEGLTNVERIATASRRIEALIFGPGDFAASVAMPSDSIGTVDDWDRAYPGHRWHYAMSRIAVAAHAAGVRAIDGPNADYRDLAAMRTSCLVARSLGYTGKWCIHPSQIPVANEVFAPSATEVTRARAVLTAYEEATAAGRGAVSVDGRMVDAASLRMARRTLELADATSGLGRK